VIRSPQQQGGPWLWIVARRGLLSSWPWLLGGDAWRTPASGGGGAQGLLYKNIFGSRMLCVIETA
jgi:hypothetical protein